MSISFNTNDDIITLNQLHKLVDIINPAEYDIVYKLLIKFIPEALPLDDEIVAIENLDNAITKGELVDSNSINWH